ncbi:MAG TPA: hypothetical protein DDX19_10760 [Rhodopirellula baltica]|uniref:Uncharacterized protein n=1 Tax=Rhodopirellula baltica (strain DSM 10527 / NCIMB 13988 / SH1) TaxID=243090 RepID=Q7UGM7_RHOBA|nr:hypothetical protein [Rhodopirellula baltica]CAD78302.1 hypothetical protein-transmembrane prediction [Rhodopirellula baltica SH 1]HBE63201.1 hypothetical protein [Rhodopirellula baltica]
MNSDTDNAASPDVVDPPNPYATGPLKEGDADDQELLLDIPLEEKPFPTLPSTILRWTLVCGIAAVPSFVIGLNVTEGQFLGMVTGIAIFVAGYVWADLVTRNRPWRRYRNIRITLRTVYILRLIVSIILPAGMIVDMFTGMIAVVTVTSISQLNDGTGLGFISTVFTTLIQGVLLNILLMVLALCIYPIVRLTGRGRQSKRLRKQGGDDQTPSDSSSESLANPLLSSSESSSSEPSLR